MLRMQRKTNRSDSSSGMLFASYLANMNATSDTFKKRGLSALLKKGKSRDKTVSDRMKIDSLVQQIGLVNSYTDDQLKLILTILMKNQIYTVKDLRNLSKASWERIEIIPSFKNSLRDAVSRGYVVADEIDRRKRSERDRSESNREVLRPKEDKENKTKPLPNSPHPTTNANNYNNDSDNNYSLGNDSSKPSRFLPPPNKKVEGDRLKVRTAEKKIYQVDRWCPRDGSDLNVKGIVIGSKLFCRSHNWSFDLESGGISSGDPENGTINARPVNDW